MMQFVNSLLVTINFFVHNYSLKFPGNIRIPIYVAGGKTALHFAAERGEKECVQLLLNAGADITIQDYDGKRK